MKLSTRTHILLEMILFPFVLFGINLLFLDNPGYFTIYYTPYMALALISASFYGRRAAYICLLSSLLFIQGLLPLVLVIFKPGSVTAEFWTEQLDYIKFFLPVTLLGIFIFGFIRYLFKSESENTRERFREIAKENFHLKNKAHSLSSVNSELEERVSKQQESITSLYTQIKKMDTLNLDKVLEVLLETVQIFTKAPSISIWAMNPGEHKLKLKASLTPETDEKRKTEIQIENTIEGWVYRNNSMFSVRMLLQYDSLARMDSAENILTLPIGAGNAVWGVLNIEEMPFGKYNFHTERILQIIINLTGPTLQKALEYNAMISKEEVDSVTKLPLYSQFYKYLDDEVNRCHVSKSNLSIIIFEIINYKDLAGKYSGEKLKSLYTDIITELDQLTSNKGNFFHYRNETQLAMVYSNLDFDGASLYCLEALEKINNGKWKLNDEEIALEVIVGYAALSGTKATTRELLNQADNLLQMQKI